MSQVLADTAPLEDQSALRRTAEGHMRSRRWQEAAETLERMQARDVACEMQLRLARNLACLKEHRAEAYETLMSARGAARYSIGMAVDGRPTIFYRGDDGKQTSMSAGNDPRAGLAAVQASQKESGLPLALYGIGDGYVLNALAIHSPTLLFDRQQAIYLIEPDAQAVMACMMIHDYSAEKGPIRQARFHWFLGEQWQELAHSVFLGDLFQLFPSRIVKQSVKNPQIEAGMHALVDELTRRYEQFKRELDAHYSKVTAAELAALFSDNPPRRPRVLVVTTRYSSVLQYSARDSADAFAKLGWDTHVFIEPSNIHVITMPKLREDLANFKPDLVLQLDHLRYELPDTFPPQLPFVCWAQDHLLNLASPAAAASVSKRDVVLTGMRAQYIDRWKYPARQCIEISKLTRIPHRPAQWEADGDDLVYVSSASHRPEDIVDTLVKQFEGEEQHGFMTACCQGVLETYAAGGSLPTFYETAAVVEQVELQRGERLRDPELRQKLIDALFDRLANILHRQQSLRWAAAVARRRGLKLAIYGPGWEKNPEFAEHARGPVKYGDELERLTRSSRINFMLEPYFCVSHQRLLDGLAAGGFFLIRHHPTNSLCQELFNFICGMSDKSVRPTAEICSVEEARAAVGDAERASLEALLNRCASLWCFGDPVAMVRGMNLAGTLENQPEALPRLAEVSFEDEASLEERVMAFVNDSDRRREVWEQQRQLVEGRLSYEAGIRRVIGRIARLLEEEAQHA